MRASRSFVSLVGGGIVVAGALCCITSSRRALAGGLDGESNTDGFNPAAELYDIAEAKRQALVARQHALNDAMIWSIYWVPGDLWGPPIGGPPVRQPIGHESQQVGPNKWIYRPLYAEDVGPGNSPTAQAPAGEPLPSPAAASANQAAPASGPELPAPSDAGPNDFVGGAQRAKPAPRGPREF